MPAVVALQEMVEMEAMLGQLVLCPSREHLDWWQGTRGSALWEAMLEGEVIAIHEYMTHRGGSGWKFFVAGRVELDTHP